MKMTSGAVFLTASAVTEKLYVAVRDRFARSKSAFSLNGRYTFRVLVICSQESLDP